MIGTARTNPGKHVSSPEHLKDAELVAPLRRVYEGLCSLEVDALISIGGDDTLKTANKLKMFPGQSSRGRSAVPSHPLAKNDRQRLQRDRLHVRILHRRGDTWPKRFAT